MNNIQTLIVVIVILIFVTFMFLYLKLKWKEKEILLRKFYIFGSNTTTNYISILKTIYGKTKKYRKVFIIIDKQSSREIRNSLVKITENTFTVAEDVIDFALEFLSIRSFIKAIPLFVKGISIKTSLPKTIEEASIIIGKIKSDKTYLRDLLISKISDIHALVWLLHSNQEINEVLDNNDKEILKVICEKTGELNKHKNKIQEMINNIGNDISWQSLLNALMKIS